MTTWQAIKKMESAWAETAQKCLWKVPKVAAPPGPAAPSFCLESATWCLKVEKPSSRWENECHTLWDRKPRHEKNMSELLLVHNDPGLPTSRLLLLERNTPFVWSLALLIHKCLNLTRRWFSSQIPFFKIFSYPRVSITSWPLCGILLLIHLYCCSSTSLWSSGTVTHEYSSPGILGCIHNRMGAE